VVSLQLCYKATKRGPVQGFGQTRMMSSQDIIFAPGSCLTKSVFGAGIASHQCNLKPPQRSDVGDVDAPEWAAPPAACSLTTPADGRIDEK